VQAYRLNVGCDVQFDFRFQRPGFSGVWKTFAHEVGHNVGAEHSFVGDDHYGGIMDYDASKQRIDGSYQFSTVFNRHNVCPVIAEMYNSGCEWLTGFSPVCGNSLQEGDEECECSDESTTCSGCADCVLTSECTAFDSDPGKAACCGADNMFVSFGTLSTLLPSLSVGS
jgi:disintegrin and metalloproteinase domain-containing protein 10